MLTLVHEQAGQQVRLPLQQLAQRCERILVQLHVLLGQLVLAWIRLPGHARPHCQTQPILDADSFNTSWTI